jgi:tyrosine-protein phosphatase SIW14
MKLRIPAGHPINYMSTVRLSVALLICSLPIVAASERGIKNFDRVDEHVYRGGQPSDEGFQYLSKIGVRTVIDLREADQRSQAEERVVTAAGMTYVNVPMTGLTPPTEREVAKLLAILEDTSSGPVFIHCQRGADRTGAVVAAYHIDHDKWDNARALEDAKAHAMSPFQWPRQNFIRQFKPHTSEAEHAVDAGSAGTRS